MCSVERESKAHDEAELDSTTGSNISTSRQEITFVAGAQWKAIRRNLSASDFSYIMQAKPGLVLVRPRPRLER